MNILVFQEKALHQFEVRQSKASVSKLLHPGFREVGVSGKSYDYDEIMAMMEQEQAIPGHLHAQDFDCLELSPDVHLLTYRSAWVDGNGLVGQFSKRSSVWVREGEDWQMKFHQGTPCSHFDLVEQDD